MGLIAWMARFVGAPVRRRLPEDAWERAQERAPWTRALDAATRARLRGFTERFLADKAISPVRGLQLTDDERVLVAMLCCRPVLHLDYGWLRGWHEVILYPGQFRAPRHEVDEETGVVSEYHDEIAGEAWSQGPVILSWADVLASVDAPEPGYDVVVHEIAHKLDGLHDDMDGAPRLPGSQVRGWARDFQAAYDALCADLDARREPPIDPYAGESPAEFFAVCSEYWFTAPDLLRDAYPAVAARLAGFYGPPATTAAGAS